MSRIGESQSTTGPESPLAPSLDFAEEVAEAVEVARSGVWRQRVADYPEGTSIDELVELLRAEGLRVRVSKGVITAMGPSALHAVYADWLQDQLTEYSHHLPTKARNTIRLRKEQRAASPKGMTDGKGATFKEGDVGIVAKHTIRGNPRGIVEIGVSQSHEELVTEGEEWILRGAGIVKFVLLIKVTEMARPSKPKDDLPPNLDPEQWYDAHEDTMIEDFVGGITTQTMILTWDAEANGVNVVEAWRPFESGDPGVEIPLKELFPGLLDASTKAFVLDPGSVVEDRRLAIIHTAMERRVSTKLKITESPITNKKRKAN